MANVDPYEEELAEIIKPWARASYGFIVEAILESDWLDRVIDEAYDRGKDDAQRAHYNY